MNINFEEIYNSNKKNNAYNYFQLSQQDSKYSTSIDANRVIISSDNFENNYLSDQVLRAIVITNR